MTMFHSTIAAPDDECIAQGAKYCCRIDRHGASHCGNLWDEQGVVRWRYATRRNSANRGWSNPFHKPDFVVAEAAGSGETVIRRASFVPPVFHIFDGDKVVGRIRLVSPLRNRYAIDIDSVGAWRFRMPLFAVRFQGDSTSGTDIWVEVGTSKKEWNILIRPGIGDRRLVAALAFIHNEWWNYG